MELTFGELEWLLAELHGVHHTKRVALLGRLKHFQRLGWPVGTNLGKGSRVRYDVRRIFSLAVAFQLLEFGLTPERAVHLLKQVEAFFVYGLLSAIARSLDTKGPSTDDHVDALGPDDHPHITEKLPSDHVYFYFDVGALQVLRNGPDEPESPFSNSGVVGEHILRVFLRFNEQSTSPRRAVLDLTLLLDRVLQTAGRVTAIDRQQVRDQLRLWRNEFYDGFEGQDNGDDKTA